MTVERAKMLTEIVHVYGYENEVTIMFARLLESNANDKTLEMLTQYLKRLGSLEVLAEMLEE